jgi:hypothetical protein
MADIKNPKGRDQDDLNPDPITGSSGSHPVGTAIGATGGAAAGAAIGSVAGPIGTVVGTAIGAVAGGLAGKGAAEAVNPTVEDEYWRKTYATRPYVPAGSDYDAYRPAYQHGWEAYPRYQGRRFDEVESDLRRDWEDRRDSRMGWDNAREAVRDAWHRVERKIPGDADKDGR